MATIECPHCAIRDAKCECKDVGGVEYYDEYSLTCGTCGYRATAVIHGGSPMSSDWDTECPYCGQNQRAHGLF
jgi:hypothetical protein